MVCHFPRIHDLMKKADGGDDWSGLLNFNDKAQSEGRGIEFGMLLIYP
jgi:hypothetical protein